MKLSVGYPTMLEEGKILESTRVIHPIERLTPITDSETLLAMQSSIKDIFVHEKVREYILRIIHRTRDSTHLSLGASPRAAMALFRACQSYAAVKGRGYAIPDDVKELANPVLQHRLILNPESRLRRVTQESVLDGVLKEVPVPAGGGSNWRS